MLSFVFIGILILALGAAAWRRRAHRKAWGEWLALRPRRFDRNLVVIGAGAGGLVSAYVAAGLQARVTLVEAGSMGGDCLHHGCVPSKTLVHHARLAHQLRRAAGHGVLDAAPALRFDAVMRQVRGAIAEIAPRDSVERYAALGVEVLQGHAMLLDPWTVQITHPDGSQRRLTTRSIVLATGARPVVPSIPGLAEAGCLTSDTLWSRLDGLSRPPGRLLVVGGGAVGCELAQAMARLGSAVTLLEAAARLLPGEDEAVSRCVTQALQADGVQVLAGQAAQRFEVASGQKVLVLAGERRLHFDEVLCATGRRPRLDGCGLEALGIVVQGAMATSACLQTRYPNILAVGDVVGPMQFTHVASHQAWHAAVNALFGGFLRRKVDERVIPRVLYVDPEVARVGLDESQARAQGCAYEVTRFDFGQLDRAVCDDSARGFIQVLTPPGKDRILGVTIVGPQAGELLAEYCLAMKNGLGLQAVLRTLHAYPTLSEANRHVAGQWRRDHLPVRLLPYLQRFHRWRRGGT